MGHSIGTIDTHCVRACMVWQANEGKAVSDENANEGGHSIFDICHVLNQPNPIRGVEALTNACEKVPLSLPFLERP